MNKRYFTTASSKAILVQSIFQMKWLSLFIILVGSFLLITPSMTVADSDCNKEGANCDKDRKSKDEIYWVKIKRLYDFVFEDFTVDKAVNDDSIKKESEIFCAFAFCEGEDCIDTVKNRKLYGYSVKLEEDTGSRNNDFVLKNGDGSTIPVEFVLRGTNGSAQENKSWNLSKSESDIKPGNEEYHRFCRNNNFIIDAIIDKKVVLQNATGNKYVGTFWLYVSSQMKKSSVLTAKVRFTVTLNIVPGIQISGLSPLPLKASSDQKKATGTQPFCVFAFGTDSFSLKGESDNAAVNSEFVLENTVKKTIPYTMTIKDNSSKEEVFSKNTSEFKGDFKPARSVLCEDGVNNMTLTINVEDIEAEAGLYQDEMTLTVMPN